MSGCEYFEWDDWSMLTQYVCSTWWNPSRQFCLRLSFPPERWVHEEPSEGGEDLMDRKQWMQGVDVWFWWCGWCGWWEVGVLFLIWWYHSIWYYFDYVTEIHSGVAASGVYKWCGWRVWCWRESCCVSRNTVLISILIASTVSSVALVWLVCRFTGCWSIQGG